MRGSRIREVPTGSASYTGPPGSYNRVGARQMRSDAKLQRKSKLLNTRYIWN